MLTNKKICTLVRELCYLTFRVQILLNVQNYSPKRSLIRAALPESARK